LNVGGVVVLRTPPGPRLMPARADGVRCLERQRGLAVRAHSGRRPHHAVMYRRNLNSKAKFESGSSDFSFKRLESSSRRFQHRFDRFNLRRLTVALLAQFAPLAQRRPPRPGPAGQHSRRVIGYHLTQVTRVSTRGVVDDAAAAEGRLHQAHRVIGYQLTQETRVYNEVDDVAGIVCWAPPRAG